MSYDVSIGRESFNYTSNLSGFFHRHIAAASGGEGGLRSLAGLTGRQAADRLCCAMDSIRNEYNQDWRNEVKGNPIFDAKYDASNGWGSATGAIIFLSQLMAACYENPRHKVHVS